MPGKKLVVCADGTWNRVEKAEAGGLVSTNVSKLASALARTDTAGNPQLLCYLEGVGTHPEEQLGGGAFGAGLAVNILRGYRFLVESFQPGDSLHFFGFSRGAYTVRSLAGLIANSGILRRDATATVDEAFKLYRDRSPESTPTSVRARVFRQMHSHESEIEFIGVWDTVGTLGVPLLSYRIWQALGYAWEFHDVELGPTVRNAFHALAIHEQRSKFPPAVWQKPKNRTNQTLKQMWFTGAHADVGGGYADCGLSDLSLAWMIDCASDPKHGGLRFVEQWKSDHNWKGTAVGTRHNEFKGLFALIDRLKRRPLGLRRRFGNSREEFETGEELHSSVRERYASDPKADFWPESFVPGLDSES